MRIAVTGANGFLGRVLLRKLAGKPGIDIVAISRSPDKLRSAMQKCANYSNLESISFLSLDALSIEDPVDVVVGCAFPRRSDGREMTEGLDYASTVLGLAVSGWAKSYINISSQSVYDQYRELPATEASRPSPGSEYAVAKYMFELMVKGMCGNMPHTNVRLASLIGPGFDQRVVNKFASKAVSGEKILVKGGAQIFDFMDVEDAGDALSVLTFSKPFSWKPIYNLGSGNGMKLIDIAREVVSCVKQLEPNNPCKIVHENIEGAQIANTSLDATLFMRDFSWKPKIDLKESIRRICKQRLEATQRENL